MMHGTIDPIDTWPQQIRALPRDYNDRPVPLCFMAEDRRLVERPGWINRCAWEQKCWVCGRKLAREFGFILTIPALIAGVAMVPPGHAECVAFPLAGIHWKTGIIAVWVGKNATVRRMPIGTVFGFTQLGKPLAVTWLAATGPASLDSVREAILRAGADLRSADFYNTPKALMVKQDIETRIRNALKLLKRKQQHPNGSNHNVYRDCTAG